MEIFDSRALAWIGQLMAELPPDCMSNYPEVAPGETTLMADDGPVMASDAIRRLEAVRKAHESGLILAEDCLDPQIKERRSNLIRALLDLEIASMPYQDELRIQQCEVSFRKGGVIVWRHRQRTLVA